MKLSLQARLIRYLRNNPNQWFAKATLCELARQKHNHATWEHTARRLRIMAEASKYGANPQSPTYAEQLKALELLDGSKIEVEHRGKNHSFYRYVPHTKTISTIIIEDGRAKEVYKEVTI